MSFYSTAMLTIRVRGAWLQQASIVGKLQGHTSPVYSVAWSPDGKSIATAAFDNTVRLWDVAGRKEIKKFDGHTKLVLSVAISPNGKQILSGSQDNTAKIWDWPVLSPSKTMGGHPGPVQALAVKPDGKLVAAASGKSIRSVGPRDRSDRQGTSRPLGGPFPPLHGVRVGGAGDGGIKAQFHSGLERQTSARTRRH